MTAGTIIYNALRLIGQLKGAGQTASTTEAADGLTFLNNIVDTWNTDRLYILYVGTAQYALTANTGSYQIGNAASSPFNVPRPLRIDKAGIVGVSVRTELQIITEAEYAQIVDKLAVADFPNRLYYQRSVALGTIFIHPLPRATNSTKLEISTWNALSSFADQTTDVPLAEGYGKCLSYRLATEMAPLFGLPIPATVAAISNEAESSIKALNAQVPGIIDVPQSPQMKATVEAAQLTAQSQPKA